MRAIGVDVGGTFTDFVKWDGVTVSISKTLTTPDAADGIATQVTEPVDQLVHGTTAATNALLERNGAVTALVTTEGFEDAIEIGRQDRPSLYDGAANRAAPLVDRAARFEPQELEGLAAADPQAVAVCLVGAHLDPKLERTVAERVRARLPDVSISASHLVSPEFREYERTSTTVLNAYLQPVVERYLTALTERLTAADHIAVMRSSGGLMTPEQAAAIPAAILLSGPAGGAMAAAALGDALDLNRIIAFDMGGTSTDVSRIESGRPELTYERNIDGHPCRMPAIAIHTVGAGGGSIAWRDPGGVLRVGPQSAGASPGPASYGGSGLEPTVTDANVVLGRLPRELSDQLVLDREAAERALDRLELGTPAEAAAGVISVVEEHMHQAIRAVSVEQGADPAGATLLAFGGAGGLHATALARSLGMARVILPPFPGVFSALGLLLSPGKADVSAALVPDAGLEQATAAVDRAAASAAADLGTMVGDRTPLIETFIDLRYRGQSHELTVPWSPSESWDILVGRFHQRHEDRNGFARRDDVVELVAVRAEATTTPELTLETVEFPILDGDPSLGAIRLVEDGSEVDATAWWRPALADEIVGPALIVEPSATTLLRTGERARPVDYGALEVTW